MTAPAEGCIICGRVAPLTGGTCGCEHDDWTGGGGYDSSTGSWDPPTVEEDDDAPPDPPGGYGDDVPGGRGGGPVWLDDDCGVSAVGLLRSLRGRP